MALIDRKSRPGLRQVKGEIFYWATDNPVEIGFKVPKARPRRADLEEVFERVRKELAPDAPSRLDCVFVCPLNRRGFCRHNDERHVYRVKVTGTIFTTDGGLWTEAMIYPESVEDWAEQYWQPTKWLLTSHAEEVLVRGTVTVIENVFQAKAREEEADMTEGKQKKPKHTSFNPIAAAHTMRGGAGAGKHANTQTRDYETGRLRSPKHKKDYRDMSESLDDTKYVRVPYWIDLRARMVELPEGLIAFDEEFIDLVEDSAGAEVSPDDSQITDLEMAMAGAILAGADFLEGEALYFPELKEWLLVEPDAFKEGA